MASGGTASPASDHSRRIAVRRPGTPPPPPLGAIGAGDVALGDVGVEPFVIALVPLPLVPDTPQDPSCVQVAAGTTAWRRLRPVPAEEGTRRRAGRGAGEEIVSAVRHRGQRGDHGAGTSIPVRGRHARRRGRQPSIAAAAENMARIGSGRSFGSIESSTSRSFLAIRTGASPGSRSVKSGSDSMLSMRSRETVRLDLRERHCRGLVAFSGILEELRRIPGMVRVGATNGGPGVVVSTEESGSSADSLEYAVARTDSTSVAYCFLDTQRRSQDRQSLNLLKLVWEESASVRCLHSRGTVSR